MALTSTEQCWFRLHLKDNGCFKDNVATIVFKQGSNIIRFVFLEYYSGCSTGNGFGKNLDAETSEKTAK